MQHNKRTKQFLRADRFYQRKRRYDCRTRARPANAPPFSCTATVRDPFWREGESFSPAEPQSLGNQQFHLFLYRLEGTYPEKFFRLPPGCKVLDVGSGYGHFVNELRYKGVDAHGIDPNEHFTETPHLKRSRFQNTQFPNGYFDYIYSAHSIFSYTDQESEAFMLACLRKAAELLKKGGKLRLGDVFIPHYEYLVRLVPDLFTLTDKDTSHKQKWIELTRQ